MGIRSKPFCSIDEQMELLQSRGLTIDNADRARQILLSNNYYNIINGYSKFFMTSSDSYMEGASFDEVTSLYIFDTEVKQAFFKAILNAKMHLKSIFAYRFAEAFGDEQYAYLNIKCYDPAKALDIVQTIHELSGIINFKKALKGSSICHYVNTYNDVPIWVLVNYIDFGKLRHMLINSQKSIQNRVAQDFLSFFTQNIPDVKIFFPEYMIDLLANINEVRNVCAHNNRLLGFRCRRDSKYWKELYTPYNVAERGGRRDAFSVYIALQCFLSKTEYAFLHNTIRKRVNHLENKLHSIDVSGILASLGFPPDWNKAADKLPQ